MLAFALFAAVLTITPGLDTMLVIRTAAASGRGPAMAAALGIGSGCLCWAVAGALGITALLTASELAYEALRWAGVGYLAVLGGRALWRARRPPADLPETLPAAAGLPETLSAAGFPETLAAAGFPESLAAAGPAETLAAGGSDARADGRPVGRDGWAALRVGFTTNLLNPKIGVFYLSVLPQFIPAGAAPLPYSLALALIHDVEGMAWFALLVLVVGRLAGWLALPTVRRRLEQVTGLVFLGFGVRLAVEKAP